MQTPEPTAARIHQPLGILALSLVLLFCAAGPAAARKTRGQATVQGVVIYVIDGDTVEFKPTASSSATSSAPVRVRLRQIDAPEICQVGGEEAKRFLSELALNQAATLISFAQDRYGRVVGSLTVNGVNLSTRMVEEGHAHSEVGRNGRGPLIQQERMAKALGRGLHASGRVVMPKDFRRAHGSCKINKPN
jgi:micrococcal nuclease